VRRVRVGRRQVSDTDDGGLLDDALEHDRGDGPMMVGHLSSSVLSSACSVMKRQSGDLDESAMESRPRPADHERTVAEPNVKGLVVRP